MEYESVALIRTLYIIGILLTGLLVIISNSGLSVAATNSSDVQEQDVQRQFQQPQQQQGDVTSDNEDTVTSSSSPQDDLQGELTQEQTQTSNTLSLDQKLSELTPAEEVSIDQEVNSAVDDAIDNPTEEPQSIKICVHREKLPDGTKGACDAWIEITIKITVN
jgi:hypothetical protein